MLSLAEAVKTGRLPEFIAQEGANKDERRGPIDRAEFDGVVAKVIKEQRSKDRTSRSSSAGGSTGK